MFLQKFGNLLRGKVTPFHIVTGALLGAVLGMAGDFQRAPGLLALLFALTLVINANLLVLGVVAILSWALGWLLTPLLFSVGQLLLDGPLAGLAAAAINAPVLAWFGFEHYVVTGGLAVGLVVGLGGGVGLAAALTSVRRRLAKLESDSAAWQKYTAKNSVKFFGWLFFGGLKAKDKGGYAALATQKVGLPVRPLGLVAVLLAAVTAWFALQYLDGPILTHTVRTSLQAANGATVDLLAAELDPASGRLTLTGLAVADPENLGTNVLAAEKLEGQVNLEGLLRRRVVIDRLEVTGATSGGPRTVPGERNQPAPPPPPPPPGEGLSVTEIFREAELWYGRLRQLQSLLDQVSVPRVEPLPGLPDTKEWEERIRREMASEPLRQIAAAHRVEGTPWILIRQIEANGVAVAGLPGEAFDFDLRNVSTQPYLVDGAPSLAFKSRSGRYEGRLELGEAARTPLANRLTLAARGLDVSTLAAALSPKLAQQATAETADFSLDGTLRGGQLDLPGRAIVRQLRIKVGGTERTVAQVELGLTATGALTNPRVKVAAPDLENLAKDVLRDEAGRQLDRALERAGDRLPGGLRGLLPGGQPPAPAPAPKP